MHTTPYMDVSHADQPYATPIKEDLTHITLLMQGLAHPHPFGPAPTPLTLLLDFFPSSAVHALVQKDQCWHSVLWLKTVPTQASPMNSRPGLPKEFLG